MPATTTLLTELSRWAQPVTAWMLTYLLHSTLLLGGAWWLSRLLGQRRLALQETAWKVALLGGIVTAGLQLGLTFGLGVEPWAGQVSLAAGADTAMALDGARADAGPADPVVPMPATEMTDFQTSEGAAVAGFAAGGAGMAAPTEAALSGPASPRRPPATAAASGPRLWPLATAATWLAVAGLGLVFLAFGYGRLYRCLAERRPVTEGALPALFGRLLERAALDRPLLARLGRIGVRLGVPSLSASARLPVPIAWGVVRREVSLPEEVVENLSPYHQESILAHEISHLRRHDPAWLALGRVLETALFFQPLNRLARRHLQEIAEYRCDDGAVALTGRPVELARCLTEVASWRVTAASRMLVPGLWVPGMAAPVGGADGGRPASALTTRVRRILAGGPDDADRLPRTALPAAAALLLAVALAAPGVTGQEPAPEPPPAAEAAEAAEAPEATETPEAPEATEAWKTTEAPEAIEAWETPEVPEAPGPMAGAPALPSVPRGAPPVPRLTPGATGLATPLPAPRSAPMPAPGRIPAVPGTAPGVPALPSAPAVPALPAPDGAAVPLPQRPPAGALPALPRAEPSAAFRVARFDAAPSASGSPSPSPAPRADSAGMEAEIDRVVTASSDEERRAVAERLEAELDALESRADAVTNQLRRTGADAGDRLETRLDELEARYDRVTDLLAAAGGPDRPDRRAKTRADLRRALTAAFDARDRVQHELERLTRRLEARHEQSFAEAHRQAEERAMEALERAEREAERHETHARDRERLERQAELRAREMERATEKHREALERRAEEMERATEQRHRAGERRAGERRAEEMEAVREAMERDAEARAADRAREVERHAAVIARLAEEARHAGPSGEEMERLREMEARERARMEAVRAEVEAKMAETERRLAAEQARIAEESAHIAALSAELRNRNERLEAEREALRAELRRLAAGERDLSAEERRRLDRELRRQLANLDEELGELSEELGELDESREEAREEREDREREDRERDGAREAP